MTLGMGSGGMGGGPTGTAAAELARLGALLEFERDLRDASDSLEREFLLVNRAVALTGATHGALWRAGQIERVAGVSAIDRNAPLIPALERLLAPLAGADADADSDGPASASGSEDRANPWRPRRLGRSDTPEGKSSAGPGSGTGSGTGLKSTSGSAAESTAGSAAEVVAGNGKGVAAAAGWPPGLPAWGLWCPLRTGWGERLGGLWLARATPWRDADLDLAAHLAGAGAFALCCQPRRSLWGGRRKLAGGPGGGRRGAAGRGLALPSWLIGLLVAAGLGAALAAPVPLTVLAPAEIIAAEPLAITAPVDGVIDEILVAPSTWVTAGTPLFRLNDTTFRNRADLAGKDLDIAAAELRKAEQLAFSDPTSQALLAILRAQIRSRRSELSFAQDLLARTEVTAPADGVALFADPNDWRGRPVATGERVMTLADPARVAVRIDLPLDDAVTLAADAPVRLFLNVAPDRSLAAVLTRASYDADLTPSGILAFRLEARLASPPGASDPPPRIGLKGTAKLYGEPVTLFFYLFRKPFAAFRRMTGV